MSERITGTPPFITFTATGRALKFPFTCAPSTTGIIILSRG
ncbi:MAG: hypothetical protein ACI4VX_04420 [Succinivibrionaceae bacterium]